MEIYSPVDPVWGWMGALYMGLPILLLFVFLMVIGASQGAKFNRSKASLYLYPLLKATQREKGKRLLSSRDKAIEDMDQRHSDRRRHLAGLNPVA